MRLLVWYTITAYVKVRLPVPLPGISRRC